MSFGRASGLCVCVFFSALMVGCLIMDAHSSHRRSFGAGVLGRTPAACGDSEAAGSITGVGACGCG